MTAGAAVTSDGCGSEGTPVVWFGVLGPLEVHRAGRAVRLGGARQRMVLGVLLAHRGQVVSRDLLIEWIWGDGLPTDPVNTLQHYIARLRGLLEPQRGAGAPARLLVARGAGYALLADPRHVDADVFRARAEAGRVHLAGGRPQQALDEFDATLALWRGEPFGEFAYAGFADAEWARLHEAHRSVLEDRFDARLACGLDSGLVPDLVEATRRFPTRERLWGQLMLALYRAGRQADALAVYRQAGRHLAEELGLDPGPDLAELHGRILRQDPALAPSPTPTCRARQNRAAGLPTPRTAFFGRQHLLTEVAEHLGRRRLVSLLGPSGIGKTRLAVEVARRVADRFPDGVRFLRLDAVSVPAMAAASLVVGLGVPEDPAQPVPARIAEYLHDKRVLLVLDGCERVADALAELVDTVLGQCGGVVVLATGQRRLGLADEVRITLSGLAIPDDATAADVGRSPAVQLFVDRARLARPAFDPDGSELTTIVGICAALAGMPLGIELAAAQVTALTASEILDGIAAGNLPPAVPGRPSADRHASLQAAIDWSLGLLPEPVGRTLASLSLLAGGFTADTAASITAVPGHDLVTHLSELVERALLYREPGSGTAARYRPVHPIRAAVLAAEQAATAVTKARLVAHYADLAVRADLGLRGPTQRDWLARLDLEHDNARAALDQAVTSGDLGGALRLAGHLSRYWDWRGHVAEANAWLRPIVEATDGPHSGERLVALVWASFFAWEQGDSDSAGRLATAALDLAETLDVAAHVSAARGILGLVARTRGEAAVARRHLEHAHDTSRAAGEHWFAAWAATGLALCELDHGDARAAARAQRYALDSFRRLGDRRGEAWAMTLRALVYQAGGEHRQATQAAGQALLLAHSVDDDRTVAWTLETLAVSAHAAGQLTRAVELLAATDALQLRRGAAEPPSKRGDYLDRLVDLEDRLGTDGFAAAWTAGRRLEIPDIPEARADPNP